MSTLSEVLSTWRTNNQSGTGHSGCMSQLTIDGSLYDIQDPALDAIVTEIESRIAAIEAGEVTAQSVTLSSTEFEETNVKAALEALKQACDDLMGASTDASSDMTLYGVKAYADELVNTLAGTNWEQNAKTIKNIIDEIENSENANGWTTAIDKLAGLGVKTPAVNYTAETAAAHNAELTGALDSTTPLTAEQATAYNTAITGAEKVEGSTLTAEEAALYNATLEGAVAAGDEQTPAVYNTVVDYVTQQLGTTVADVQALDAAAIKSVNGVARAANDQTGGITLTGTNIEVSGTDNRTLDTVIASLESNKANKTDIEANERVVAAALNDLNINKANKAAISTSTINNWSSSYANGNLVWTSTQPTVYVPVSGQTL